MKKIQKWIPVFVLCFSIVVVSPSFGSQASEKIMSTDNSHEQYTQKDLMTAFKLGYIEAGGDWRKFLAADHYGINWGAVMKGIQMTENQNVSTTKNHDELSPPCSIPSSSKNIMPHIHMTKSVNEVMPKGKYGGTSSYVSIPSRNLVKAVTNGKTTWFVFDRPISAFRSPIQDVMVAFDYSNKKRSSEDWMISSHVCGNIVAFRTVFDGSGSGVIAIDPKRINHRIDAEKIFFYVSKY
ncbi:hypothetical protein LptCag_0053 [Leptospirillum ferriphilum]|uniref:Uncharacterized protein n=1 Tax=Leptospirillum ferriphilum TaxID=178606 RepID=A0A094WA82_9BACT|nr:hypothetical protein [Leptospirillum ferriphilum]KGA93440.1 hypothetical protein LptCag_0053 [Leptospirillum ferriphilum]